MIVTIADFILHWPEERTWSVISCVLLSSSLVCLMFLAGKTTEEEATIYMVADQVGRIQSVFFTVCCILMPSRWWIWGINSSGFATTLKRSVFHEWILNNFLFSFKGVHERRLFERATKHLEEILNLHWGELLVCWEWGSCKAFLYASLYVPYLFFQLSYADFHLYEQLDQHKLMCAQVLDDFPNLKVSFWMR